MQRPTERLRDLVADMDSAAIVAHVVPYYHGYQFEGEWLDTLKESIEGELDDLDRTIRGRAHGSTDRLREYVANAPASSMGETARAIVRNYCDAIEREAMEERTAAYNEGYDAGFASADDWAAQHEDAMAEHGWVRLPVDAEGVPIHIGDVIAYEDNTMPKEVVALVPPSVVMVEDGPRYVDMCRHYHAPTVEDVLREFAYGLGVPVADSYVAATAAKLRLAEDNNELYEWERDE